MKVCWLIDGDIFGHYRDELVAEIRGQGHDAKFADSPNPGYSWDDEGNSHLAAFSNDACVVVHGAIDLVTRVQRAKVWTPGVFATVSNFACSSYFCHFGEFLLNRDYIMLPFAELSRRRDFLFDTLAVDDTVFVRPDSPLKLFTGQTARRETFDGDLELMGFYDFPRNALVVVSRPQEIVAEWRFVIADGKVISGSEYTRDGVFAPQPRYELQAHELAVRVASAGYEPDPVWVMDICQTSDEAYHLLEIGGFSFADLYANDKRAVVEAVSATALEVWESSRRLRKSKI